MIRTIVVDDEKPSREVMCNYLRDYCEGINIVATASSVKTAFKSINKHKPDLVFLDIELGDGNGFGLLKMFEKINFRIIFVTAFSEFAVRAFRVSAVDYLLKPIKIDELQSAVNKLKEINGITNNYFDGFNILLRTLTENKQYQQTLSIPSLKGFEVLKIDEIILCKADSYCTHFHLTNNRKVISSKNLRYYEDLLTECNFIRVHHSYLVNLHHICSYSRLGEILMTDGNKAILGDAYKSTFISRFSKR